ncbi:MAG: hypothetical protein RL632_174 [Bacteroidota bacterium]
MSFESRRVRTSSEIQKKQNGVNRSRFSLALCFVCERSEISSFLKEDFNRIIECEFTLSNPRLEREGVPKYRDKM